MEFVKVFLTIECKCFTAVIHREMAGKMGIIRTFAVALVFAVGINAAVAAAGKISITDKANLQATMQRHISDRLVDGAYLHLKKETGKVRKLYAVAAHPTILQVGEFFVLCSDFRDKNGKTANIDFYIARDSNRYVIFRAVVDDRRQLGLFRKSNR